MLHELYENMVLNRGKSENPKPQKVLRSMLDINYIRDNQEQLVKAAKAKNFSIDIPALLALDSKIRPAQQELEHLQAERNRLSKEIATAAPQAREELKEKVTSSKSRMEALADELRVDKDEFRRLMLLVPQPARDDVPLGKDDSENVEVKKWGTVPKFDFPPLDHISIGEKLGLVDFRRGVKLSGSRSYVLTGDGALLEQAVLRFTFDMLVQRGYTPMSIPVLVQESAMEGTGYFPVGREQAYYIEADKLALVGTSEVPLCSFHSDEILKEEELPKKFIAQSSCFRREAGTYGKDTKGLYRVHQFQKIEQVVIAPADKDLSEVLHSELLKNAEDVLQALELPYRVVYVCTGDLGQGQVRKHDIETWMPSRDGYGETHSCSTFYDFQARRLGIRYKDSKAGKNVIAYTLNNTAVASPRILIPLLENGQTKDGRVRVPKVLRPYLQGREFLG
jgi:seryl-tRNA synthetase